MDFLRIAILCSAVNNKKGNTGKWLKKFLLKPIVVPNKIECKWNLKVSFPLLCFYL